MRDRGAAEIGLEAGKLTRSIALVAAAVAGFALALAVLPKGSFGHLLVADLGMSLASLLAGVLALRAAAQHADARARRSWLLIGLGILSWSAGDMVSTVFELSGARVQTPSLADIGYLLMVPFVLAGILTRPLSRPREISRALLLLDAGIAVAALIAASWTLVIGPLFAETQTSPLAQAVTLAYPFGDLAILLCLLSLVLREAESRSSTRLLMIGFTAIALADSSYLLLDARKQYYSGHPVDLLWLTGLLLLTLAAWAGLQTEPPWSTEHHPGRPWRFIAPALLVLVAGAVVWLAPQVRERSVPGLAELAFALSLVLLLWRSAFGYRLLLLAREREHELRAVAERLADEEARARAHEELSELKTEFISTLSHELRTPLSLIHGYAELLAVRGEQLSAHQVAEMAGEILDGSRTMGSLLDGLLDFLQMEQGRLSLFPQQMQIAALLSKLSVEFASAPGGTRIQLDLEDGLEAAVDAERFVQVVRELLNNALVYAPAGPIIVRAADLSGQLRVEVIDQGPGIPPEEQPRVWERFFRGASTRSTPNRGGGIGLTVARRLVELHNGQVGLLSKPGQGTTFWLSIPFEQSQALQSDVGSRSN